MTDRDNRDPEEWLSIGRAMLGLADGNLRPLALHIRAGYPIDGALALDLAQMIEGDHGDDALFGDNKYILKAMGRDGNKTPFTARLHAHQRKVRIGLYIYRRVEAGGPISAAISDAAKHFSREFKSTVTFNAAEAAKYYLDKMERGEAKGFAAIDPLGSIATVSEQFPDE